MSQRALRRWATDLCSRRFGHGADWLVALTANRVADAIGLSPVADGPLEPPGEWPAPPGGWADPWLVGIVHEQSASPAHRRARGAWYTPKPVVVGLLRLATLDDQAPARIVDPTCGGGAFLLAALDRLVELGVEPVSAVDRVGGIDLDPLAARAAEWSVKLWLGAQLVAGGRVGTGSDLGVSTAAEAKIDVRQGDSLDDWPAAWSEPMLVAGNPPFASPLKRGAVPSSVVELRAERSELLGPYADVAAVHLLDSVEKAGSGSTVVLVQPQSILASRDTDPLRAHLDEHAPLVGLWVAREPVFDAGVRACAPVLAVGERDIGERAVTLAAGPAVVVEGQRPTESWGALAASALGAPPLPRLSGRLGDLVTATAGFRDEHYGLVSVCREATAGEDGGDGVETARLVNVGSIDPLDLAWGLRPMRFGGRDWERPIVARAGLSDRVARWFDGQLRPKVLLATQSKLLEPVVDRDGDLMPATPLIAVHADIADLDHVAAVLLAPPVVLWAWRRWFGTALTVDGVKLAARQVGELPLPLDRDRWDEAAGLVASAPSVAANSPERLVAIARLMTDAYNARSAVLDWWLDRLRGARAGAETSPHSGQS